MARQLIIELVGDEKRFVKSMGEAGKTADSFSDKLKSISGKATDAGKKMTVGLTAPIVAGMGASAKAASDFNESLSKVNAVFGDWALDVEQMADGAAKSMGLSKSAALDAAGSFGNLFTQLGFGKDAAFDMSKGMLQLSADFASFHNADISDVIDAQSAAFRGEYDSLQRFLPLINAATVEQRALQLTGKKTTDELTAQDKALAVNKLMHEGAGKAAGDFARTSDGLANSTRIAKAEMENASISMGQALAPVTERLSAFVGGLAEKFSGLTQSQQTTILIVGGLLAVLGPLVTLIGTLGTVMAFVAANPIVLVIAGIAALAAGLVYAYKNSETFRNLVDAAFNAVRVNVETMWRVVGPILNGFFDVLRRIWDIAGKVAGPIGNIVGKVGGIVGKLPGFANGGVVPGPVGQAQLAMVHGGERITPYRGGRNGGDGGMSLVVNVHGSVIAERDLGRTIADAIRDNGIYGVS